MARIKEIAIRQDDGKVRVIGHYDEQTRTLFIKRNKKKHFMKKLNAWGLDAEVFTDLKGKGMEKVVLTITDKVKTVMATVDDFSTKGKFLHFKPHRAQIFLEESFWRRVQ